VHAISSYYVYFCTYVSKHFKYVIVIIFISILHISKCATFCSGNATEYFFAFSSIHHHGINGRSLVLPPSNFYQDDYETAGTKCDEELCNNQSCQCTYVQKLPRNASIFLKWQFKFYEKKDWRYGIFIILYTLALCYFSKCSDDAVSTL